jgi:uncharacterized membrane protein (DUF4010 family)
LELYERLAIALAIGLLIGVERGWKQRAGAEGSRIAGMRTFGLIGLLGGVSAILAGQLGIAMLGFAFVVLAAVMVGAYAADNRIDRDHGVTTIIAALVTFALGAMAASGLIAPAAATAVVTATLLALKPVLHRWLQGLEQQELYAGLRLLLISVVLLPVLPNQGYGPWQALNPYEIWWMVVLIAAISFVGYVAIRLMGTERGIFLTSLIGGLVSSTAVTLNLARQSRNDTSSARLLAAGVAVAAATMSLRTLLLASIINLALLPLLAWPLGLMALTGSLLSVWLLRRAHGQAGGSEMGFKNPLELRLAIYYGLLLALIMLLSQASRAWLGQMGIYLVGALSGITDVDPVTLSLARMSRGNLGLEIATRGIVVASLSNSVSKTLLVAAIANTAMALRVVAVFAAMVCAGLLGVVMISN